MAVSRRFPLVSRIHDAEVILVGDELLKGERRDAHLGHVGRGLLRCGVRVSRSHTVGDEPGVIAGVVRECLPRTRVLVVTGGLGPTKDDITRVGVSEALGLELEFHEPSWKHIVEMFARHGAEATENNRQQAMFPVGATVIENDNGSAPGFAVAHGETTVFVLPGPPRELQPMFDRFVVARVWEIFGREALRVETFRTIGVGESTLVTNFGELFDSVTDSRISFLPSLVGVDIVLTQTGKVSAVDAEAVRMEAALREGIGNKFYEHGERSLAEVVHDRLIERGETLGIAESLTGGMLGDMFVAHPGSSAYLRADVVTYCDESKHTFLGVRKETLKQFGAVSEETCTEMAHGIRNRTEATWGMATTGIAGPSGATAKKPVGLTYIGVAWDGGSRVKRIRYHGNRTAIRERAAWGAMWLLFDRLRNE